MSDTKALFEQMTQRFNAEAAGDMDEVFQYDIEGEGTWQVHIADGQCKLSEGEPDDASIVLSMDKETLEAILKGETDGMQAFMAGKVKATGDMMLGTRLTKLFPVS